ncbi:MAG: hypothetical protein V7646_4785 [Pseudonocardia sp.]
MSVNPVDVKVHAQVDPGSTPRVLGFDAAGVVVATGVAVGPAVIVRVSGGPGRRGPTMPRSSFRSRDRGALLFQGAAASPAALRRLRRRHGTAFRTELIEPADRIPTLGGAIGVRNRGHISPPLSAAPSRSAPSSTSGVRPRCGSATAGPFPERTPVTHVDSMLHWCDVFVAAYARRGRRSRPRRGSPRTAPACRSAFGKDRSGESGAACTQASSSASPKSRRRAWCRLWARM